MARTRAERRHNTYVKTSARKRYRDLRMADDWSGGGHYHGLCWGNITEGGERKQCRRCITSNAYEVGGGWYDSLEAEQYAIRHGFALDAIDIFDFT